MTQMKSFIKYLKLMNGNLLNKNIMKQINLIELLEQTCNEHQILLSSDNKKILLKLFKDVSDQTVELCNDNAKVDNIIRRNIMTGCSYHCVIKHNSILNTKEQIF